MKSKKLSDMTFKEFAEEVKKRGATTEITYMLNLLRKEGFSEEQLNEMNMQKVWDIFLTAMGQEFEQIFSVLGKTLEQYKGSPQALQPFLNEIEKLRKMLEGWIAEYE